MTNTNHSSLEAIHRPAQAPSGLTELEWLAYLRWYREGVERGQLLAGDAVPQESPGDEPGPAG